MMLGFFQYFIFYHIFKIVISFLKKGLPVYLVVFGILACCDNCSGINSFVAERFCN